MSQPKPTPKKYSPKSKAITNSKEKALNKKEFEFLVEGTYSMKDYFDVEARLIIFLAGRLGMRVGEIVHMKSSWIDQRNQMINIPIQQNCNKGKNGDVCGYCLQNAKQMARIRRKWRKEGKLDGTKLDDIEGNITKENMKKYMWSAKTPSAAREIPFDASPRAEIIIERYFNKFSEFKTSKSGINRRINRTAKFAKELDPNIIHPHGLRATAATYWAGRGLDTTALQSIMGWADMQVAMRYIAENGERTAQAMRDI